MKFYKLIIIFFPIMLMLPIDTYPAPSGDELIHHIIVLIDRGGDIRRKGKPILKEIITNDLRKLCFTKGRVIKGRKLLDREKGDYLSVISLGLEKSTPDFRDFIQTDFDGKQYGFKYRQDFSNNEYDRLWRNINIDFDNFFDKNWSALTVAIPMAINSLKERQPKVHKTYLILISDGKISELEPRLEVKRIQNASKTNADRGIGGKLKNPNLPNVYNKTLRRHFNWSELNKTVERGGLIIEIFEIWPLTSAFAIESIIVYDNLKVDMFKTADGFRADYKITSRENPLYEIIGMKTRVLYNEKSIAEEQSFGALKGSQEIKIFLDKDYDSKELELKMKFWVHLKDNAYGVHVLHPDGGESQGSKGLTRMVPVRFEGILSIWGIVPITGKLLYDFPVSLGFETQESIKLFWEVLSVIFLICALLLFIYLLLPIIIGVLIHKTDIEPEVEKRDMVNSEVEIDFMRRGDQPIVLKNNFLTIPHDKQYTTIWGRKVKRHFRINNYRAWLEVDQPPESIQINDITKLILLKHGRQQPSNDSKSFFMETAEYPIEIRFDPKQITDCTDHSRNEDMIRFRFKYQYTPKSDLYEEPVELKLKFKRAYSEPKLTLITEPEFKTGYEYRQKDHVKLGALEIENHSDVEFANTLDCELYVKFDINEPHRQNVVFFGEKEEIAQSSPYSGVSGGVRPIDEKIKSDTDIKAHSDNHITFSNILPKNVISIPIYIDLTRIVNPMGKAEYSFTVSAEYKIDNNIVPKSSTEGFIITQDKRTTSLMAIIRYLGTSKKCIHSDEENIPANLQWSGPGARGAVSCFTLKIGNYAENGTGGVHIKNFNVNFLFDAKSTSTISPASLNDIFLINNTSLKNLEKDYYFPNQLNSAKSLEVTFRNDTIKQIPDDISTINCFVTFDYIETDKELKDNETLKMAFNSIGKSFSYAVIFKIEKNPGPYWLAIDFGTSAIVAAFDSEVAERTQLINLQKSLERMFKSGLYKDVKGEHYKEEQIDEFGSDFLSSTIVCRKGGVINVEEYDKEYDKELAFLAPSKQAMSGPNFKFLLPYLKSLIGTEKIPNDNENFESFTYKIDESDTVDVNFKDRPLEVKDILISVYRCLLRDFIIDQIEKAHNKSDLNKVILTVPNTFTPKHIDLIKNLIIDRFKNYFKKDYITFISESDAVACYYIAKWSSLNWNRDEKEKSKYKDSEEFVLIYDMGAGTLDLTYLKIKTDGEGNKEVFIIGRLGKGSAGNYLDYLIGKEIYEKNKNDFDISFHAQVAESGMSPQRRFNFKYYVKDNIKPKLNSTDGDFSINTNVGLKPGKSLTIKFNDLLESSSIKDFIRINAEEVFENFFDLHNNFDGKIHTKGNIPIDTVIFSGRSIQFERLREAIKSELKQYTANPNIYFIEDLEEKSLKNAVSLGALQYALVYREQDQSNVKITNHNLQARYGILYHDPGSAGTWLFKELLNPSTKPLNKDNPHLREGITVYEYDTDPDPDNITNIIDLNHTAKGYFVQSFSVDTARDMNNNNMEYITVMFEFHKNMIVSQGKKVPVRVIIDKDNEMTVHIGNYRDDPMSPMKVNLLTDTFKNSMWPYLN